MIVVNRSHPLVKTQVARLEALEGTPVDRVPAVRVPFDAEGSSPDQARPLVASIELTGGRWRTLPLVLNLPSCTGGWATSRTRCG